MLTTRGCMFVVGVVLVGLSVMSCKNTEDKSIDLGDPALEAAYKDYRAVICSKDIEALRRLIPKSHTKFKEEQYEYFLKEMLFPGIIEDCSDKGYMEWFESSYVVRKEFFDDGQKVNLWLGPETDNRFHSGSGPVATSEPDPDAIERKRFHEQPLQFQKSADRWTLYFPK